MNLTANRERLSVERSGVGADANQQPVTLFLDDRRLAGFVPTDESSLGFRGGPKRDLGVRTDSGGWEQQHHRRDDRSRDRNCSPGMKGKGMVISSLSIRKKSF